MKKFGNPILSLAAPLLILLGVLALLQRHDNDRFHALPALIVGSGLIISGALGRKRRREKLLLEIRKGIRD